MLKRGSAHLRALSLNEVPAKGQRTPRSSNLKARGDTSLCIDVQKNSALMTTNDTEDTISTKINRNKMSFRTLISQRTSQRYQSNKISFSAKIPATPVRGVRNIILPSFQSQKQEDVTPTWKEISDFSQYQTINYGLAFLERKKQFEAAKIKEKRFYSQTRQNNPIPKKLKQLQKNLFKVNTSKKSFIEEKPKKVMLCPQENFDTRTVSSFHREQSVSVLSRSRTNVFDSVRASSSGMSSADLSDRLKEIDDLNEMMGELEIMRVNTEYNHDFATAQEQEKKIIKKRKRLDYLQTEASSIQQKQYLNLDQLLDTEESATATATAAVNNVLLPKIYLNAATPRVSGREVEKDFRENFKKMIYKGIGRDPQCRMDPSLILKMNQDRVTFEKRLRRITQKNLKS